MSTSATPPVSPSGEILYICGSGHSGSTLLDMLLGGHSQISSLGEAHRLYVSARKSSPPHLCACGRHVLQCGFWQKVGQELRGLRGGGEGEPLLSVVTTDPRYVDVPDDGQYLGTAHGARLRVSVNRIAMAVGSRRLWHALAALSPEVRTYRTIIADSLLVYEAVRRAWGTPVIVDSTKNAARLQGFAFEAPESLRVVYLLRDGRAVCHSRMRRERVSMEDSVRRWKREHWKLGMVLKSLPPHRVVTVRYEDLAREPEGALRRIAALVGLKYEPEMLDLTRPRHNLAGNPARFRVREAGIVFDERWRAEMTAADLAVFRAGAGDLNRQFGYDA